jgi:putative transposase
MEGAIHHVYARGVAKQEIFRDDADHLKYLELLADTIEWLEWRCLAYCLMRNHLHLLVETPLPNLGVGIQDVHGRYGRYFNDRHDRVGHLFQGRYGAILIETDEQFQKTVAYIGLNPVEAGLCVTPADWRWSSSQALRDGPIPRWLDVDRLGELCGVIPGNP